MASDAQDPAAAPVEIEDKKLLIEYPTVYTFKIMGKQAPDFAECVKGLFREVLGTSLAPEALQEQSSSKGKYVSLSVTVNLESEEQRRALYIRLKAEPRIVYYL